MFRRNDNASRNNGQPEDDKVREENRAEEEIRQEMGNQAGSGSILSVLPNIGNEAINNMISGGGNRTQNVIRKGPDISDKVPHNINISENKIRNSKALGDDELNNITSLNSSDNIIKNDEIPKANGIGPDV